MRDRFVKSVVKTEHGCHEWVGYINSDGYGRFWDGKSSRVASRVAYELFVGPIASGLEIDHLCRNRACVNPEHLEAVTRKENIARSEAGKPNLDKTTCPQGHPYSGANLYSFSGKRACRACRDDAARRYRAKKRIPVLA